MKFHLHGKHYKLYGNDYIPKEGKPQPPGIYIYMPKKKHQVKILQVLVHTLQKTIVNAQYGNPSSFLKLFKDKDASTREIRSTRENLI